MNEDGRNETKPQARRRAQRSSPACPAPVAAPSPDPYQRCGEADAAPLSDALFACSDLHAALRSWRAAVTGERREGALDYNPDFTTLAEAKRESLRLVRELEKLLKRLP